MILQLNIQAEGLSGHLSLFWPDISESVWVGGNGDGGLHERAPYWLNGIVPLAYLLRNAGAAVAPPGGATAGAVCQNGTDAPYGDINSFQVQDAAACAFACNGTEDCVGFVVDDCDPSAVTCWLKRAVGALVNASCRCTGLVRAPHPPQPLPEGAIMTQMRRYVDYILAHAAPDGWIGPPDDALGGDKYWGRFDILLALEQ